MLERFLANLSSEGLIKKNDTVLVGLSGGIDSVVLLDLLLKVREEFNLNLIIAHVNYGLRKTSERDQKFVQKLAEKNNLPIFEKQVSLSGPNIEERARTIRYDFFEELAQSQHVNVIAVAHQKNDLAETLLMNLIRGTGPRGLSGIPSRRGSLIRPLLIFSRKEIKEYAKKNKVKFVEDETNKSLKYTRNMIRHKLIKTILELNPNFLETAETEANTFSEISRFLIKEAAGVISEEGRVDLAKLRRLDPLVQKEVIRLAIEQAKGDLKDITAGHVKDVLSLSSNASGSKKINLPGLNVRRVYDKIYFEKDTKTLPKPKQQKLKTGKTTYYGGWSFFLNAETKAKKSEKDLVFIDIQKAGELLVRSRHTGDRIKTKGGTRKIQDIFVDYKIPLDDRDSFPLIANKNEIIWIPGLAVNSEFLPDKKSNDIISIKAKEEQA